MTTENFYHDLPALESFAEAIETDRHAAFQRTGGSSSPT